MELKQLNAKFNNPLSGQQFNSNNLASTAVAA